jgi:hypothetical protein
MPAQALDDRGWRIPFLLGLLAGFAGYLLRRHVLEITAGGSPGSARRSSKPCTTTGVWWWALPAYRAPPVRDGRSVRPAADHVVCSTRCLHAQAWSDER